MTPAVGLRAVGADFEVPVVVEDFVGAMGFEKEEADPGFFAEPPRGLAFDWVVLEEGERDALAMGRSYHGAAVVGAVDGVLGGRALPADASRGRVGRCNAVCRAMNCSNPSTA
jgi:hypothetical protein